MLLDEEAGFLCKFGQVSCANILYSVLDTLGGHVLCCWPIGVSIALGFSCSSHACLHVI